MEWLKFFWSTHTTQLRAHTPNTHPVIQESPPCHEEKKTAKKDIGLLSSVCMCTCTYLHYTCTRARTHTQADGISYTFLKSRIWPSPQSFCAGGVVPRTEELEGGMGPLTSSRPSRQSWRHQRPCLQRGWRHCSWALAVCSKDWAWPPAGLPGFLHQYQLPLSSCHPPLYHRRGLLTSDGQPPKLWATWNHLTL